LASNKGGRPKVEFDLEMVAKLSSLHCTLDELAAFFECDVSTIKRRKSSDPEFCAAIYKGRERGKTSLRDLQFKAAKRGNVSMQIWLGKNILNQSDRSLIGEDPTNPFQGLKADADAAIQKILVRVEREPVEAIDTSPVLEGLILPTSEPEVDREESE